MVTKGKVPVRSHKKKVPMTLPVTEIPESILSSIGLKSIGKPATILYKKLPDDMVLITGFENFLNLEEIFDKYGKIVSKAYMDFPYYMAGLLTGAIYLMGIDYSTVTVGKIFNKHDFSRLIAHVKKCGGLLHDIIQACDKGEVKRIEI